MPAGRRARGRSAGQRLGDGVRVGDGLGDGLRRREGVGVAGDGVGNGRDVVHGAPLRAGPGRTCPRCLPRPGQAHPNPASRCGQVPAVSTAGTENARVGGGPQRPRRRKARALARLPHTAIEHHARERFLEWS
ncbi:MAG: hypothetical protein GEV08_08610 [Acidimicrobiia bacterium]|nr:hypothetical protein [Acidimicrobiia bacterium]